MQLEIIVIDTVLFQYHFGCFLYLSGMGNGSSPRQTKRQPFFFPVVKSPKTPDLSQIAAMNTAYNLTLRIHVFPLSIQARR
jgi:hypothetical protein